MDVQAMLAKQEIHEALMRYARGVDRGDAELICSAYHPDAVDEHGVADYTGVTVRPGLVELMARLRVSSHHITNHLIMLPGRYVDRFEKRDGEWRIARRLVIVEHTSVQPLDASAPPSAPGRGSRDRDDPSYRVLAPQTEV
jgi:hypothetical protein